MEESSCIYNRGVLCAESAHNCAGCGWRPEVAKSRLERLRKKLKKQLRKKLKNRRKSNAANSG